MMEASPDIGLVIPPVIHVGFGTLGHSWFNNRAGFAELAEALDLDIPLDRFTPVTAYGTMYWFRPKALRKMFAHDWRWDAYNPEPRHIDGGLAHVQERLIGPVVQDAGYRTMTVMTPRNAGRNYARLEYKHQLLSGHLSSANVYHQVAEVERHAKRFRMRLFIGMRETYGAILRRYPGVHPYLRPLAQKVYRVWLPAGAGDRHD